MKWRSAIKTQRDKPNCPLNNCKQPNFPHREFLYPCFTCRQHSSYCPHWCSMARDRRRDGVLVSWSHHNKYHRLDGWKKTKQNKTPRNFFCHSSRSRVWLLVRTISLSCRWLLSCSVLIWPSLGMCAWREISLSLSLSLKGHQFYLMTILMTLFKLNYLPKTSILK